MDFNVATTSYDSMPLPIGAPMFHPQSEQFVDQLSVPTTTSVHTTHHNLSDFYQLPSQQSQSLAYFEDQLAMPTAATTTTTTVIPAAPATPSNHTNSSKDAQKKKPKRKQVKNACGKFNNNLLICVAQTKFPYVILTQISANVVNCQKACKKCDDGRACQRCIKLGLTATCVDSPRKERRKGIKRGPYKKRQPRSEHQQQQQQEPQLMLHAEWYDNMEYRGPSLSSSPTSSLSSSWNQQHQQPYVSMEQQDSLVAAGNFFEQPCYPVTITNTHDMTSFVPSNNNNNNTMSYPSSSSDDGFGQSPSISSTTAYSPCSPATPPPPAANTLLPVVPSQQSYTQQIALLQKRQQRTMEQQKAIEQQIMLSMQQQQEEEEQRQQLREQQQQQQQLFFTKQQQEQQQFLQVEQMTNMSMPTTSMTDSWQFFL
ncbi:hypothetical protein BDB00DRAFT_532195 [Zychaea mexicana]|uniref:uncharacterized protein n=1 Tax=Zychaea mexicana TaxID=64656 RepID=UPI0022FDF518|nr:uncharacterized protein BDB00DRAFT_532195 [Zychaea mexicana]KAI9490700.1 hypothetical protein BDB00DRAFT_532195 [Zychaea mexicana]